ncbi:GntR family transcriptional regulator [Gimesia sp.]|uniref:GntR family transcriptional regulator n=1 Tax=Gimesia sp. TaxID=2024833 RepID=UPI000C5B1E78|nr:GntR family transcriptional regulator [Gimesia sp.]MAX39772.1 hypothetical protein [Gimesia sp.]HAH45573.1 hypothetical protein [Planctomycetaceae bacterium]HBL42469.1 hypothetical protein [Planctomycetaceae bacterium]|tara:strand:- start:38694 stop:39383 length:690 start_codon:yes stop_codon:yes gene_type:complete
MHETLQAKAYRAIRERLLTGVDPQGTRISDFVLSKTLGISRAPIREAMNRLISERLLVQKAGLGVFVPRPTREEIENLYQVREWLEIGALETVVSQLDLQSLQLMEESCATIRSMAKDLEEADACLERGTSFPRLSEADSQFHLTIMRATGNKLLLDLMQSNRVLEQVWDISVRTYSAKVVHRICDEHEEILAAIKNRDPEQSRQSLSNHLRIGRDITLRYYDQKLLQD